MDRGGRIDMHRLWKSLALSLIVFVPAARSQDATLRSPVSIGRPVVQMGRPVVPADSQQTLQPVVDPRLQPASFSAAPDPRAAVYSTPPEGGNVPMFTWRAADDELAPRPKPVPAPAPTPCPGNPGRVSSGSLVPQPNTGCAPPRCNPCTCADTCCGLGCLRLWGSNILDTCKTWYDSGDLCLDPDGCYPGNCFYARGEYLLWWTKGSPTPPLITQGTVAQGMVAQGALIPGTTVIFGGSDIAADLRQGGRFTAGYWFTDDHLIGIEGRFFFLGDLNSPFLATSNGNPPLARPVDLLGTPGRELIAGNQLTNGVVSSLAGSVAVGTTSSFWGAEANLRTNLMCGCNYFVDIIAGFRTMGLDEALSVNESLMVINTTPNVPGANGTSFFINDTFATKNRFYGGQLGTEAELRWGRWTLGADVKLGLGVTEQTANINGFTTTIPGPGGIGGGTNVGGLLTRPGVAGNIGHHFRDQFSVVPEVGLNLGYQLTKHVRVFVGYNFLYWTNVARPGGQIDLTVDPSQAFGQNNPNGANRPTFNFHNSEFWAQGVNLGMEIRW
jgi:hypothetical protein